MNAVVFEHRASIGAEMGYKQWADFSVNHEYITTLIYSKCFAMFFSKSTPAVLIVSALPLVVFVVARKQGKKGL